MRHARSGGARVVARSLQGPVEIERKLSLLDLETHQKASQEVYVDRQVVDLASHGVDVVAAEAVAGQVHHVQLEVWRQALHQRCELGADLALAGGGHFVVLHFHFDAEFF